MPGYRGVAKRSVFAAIACAAILSCAPADPASAQDGKALGETLSAGERADFVNESRKDVSKISGRRPKTGGVSEAMISAYCRCTAEQMVMEFNAAEIDRIVENITPELQVRVDRIEKACVPKAR
jgi:hypothetical protein